MFRRISNFLNDVKTELKKVSWSTRSELISATVVVITTALALAALIGAWDFVLARFVRLIIR